MMKSCNELMYIRSVQYKVPELNSTLVEVLLDPEYFSVQNGIHTWDKLKKNSCIY